MSQDLRQHKIVDDHQSASWSNLPRKQQLGILTLSRVLDSMQVASFQTVCYYQLKSFDASLSEQTLSWQSGVASGSFSGAQILTSMIWGRVADAEWCGRKNVLLLGLMGTGLSCVGLAFSRNFESVVISRFLAGAFHVTIGTVRTMMSENIQEKKHQARAFLLLPAAVMVASILGSVCGSRLADPMEQYSSILDYTSRFGKALWIEWMKSFPYAPPALMSACCMFCIALIVFLMIEETLEDRKRRSDLGLRIFASLKRRMRSADAVPNRRCTLVMDDVSTGDLESSIDEKAFATQKLVRKQHDFRGIWTLNIVAMLFAQAIFDFHMGAFDSLLPLFLSTPRSSSEQRLPFGLDGGLGMEPRRLAVALTMIGFIGLAIQFVFYPSVNNRFGNSRIFRIFCIAFPVAYSFAPYLVAIPSNHALFIWTSIALILTIHTMGRIFVLPATIALLNNSATNASVLGTIHGIGQTITAVFRTAGPMSAGYLFSVSLERGAIGTVWWVMALVAIGGWIASRLISERQSSPHGIAFTAATRSVSAVEAFKTS